MRRRDSLLDGRQKGRVQCVCLSQVGNVLALKDVHVLVVVEVDKDQAEDLAKVQPSDHLLERLLARTRGVSVDDLVELGPGKHLVLIVEGSPLAVNSHGRVRRHVHVGELRNRADILHVGGVATGAKDAANLHLGVGVGGRDHGSRGVVDQGRQLDGDALENTLLSLRSARSVSVDLHA